MFRGSRANHLFLFNETAPLAAHGIENGSQFGLEVRPLLRVVQPYDEMCRATLLKRTCVFFCLQLSQIRIQLIRYWVELGQFRLSLVEAGNVESLVSQISISRHLAIGAAAFKLK